MKTSLIDERRRYKIERRKLMIVTMITTNYKTFWSYDFRGNMIILRIYY